MKNISQTLFFFSVVMAFLLGGLSGAKRSEARIERVCNSPEYVNLDVRGDGVVYIACKRSSR